MLKMTIDDEEVVSKNNFTIKEEMLSASSTILNNTYPKTWEQDHDYISRFYYPKDYAKLNIQNFSITPEEAGTTIDIVGSATLNDVDTTKESRVISLKGQTSQTGTPTPSSPIPVNVVSGDNEIEICGKNLFDIGTSNNDYVNQNDNTVTSANLSVSGSVISMQILSSGQTIAYRTQKQIPNKTYIISGTTSVTGGRLYVRLRNLTDTGYLTNSDVTITGWTYNSFYKGWYAEFSTTTINKSIVIPNCLYWELGVGYASNEYVGNIQTISNVQLEYGTSSTTYEPYIGNTYPIYLGDIELCKIGTYQDYIYKDNGSWYLHKEIGKVVLDGSENWTYQSQYPRFTSPYNGDLFTTSILNNDVYSNYYKVGQTSDTNNTISFWTNGGSRQVLVHDERFTTKEQYNTWLSSNNVICYGILYTPTTTEITDETLKAQLDDLESQ